MLISEQMIDKGCTEEEVKSTLKLERRKEEKFLKREKSKGCYRCRGFGHRVAMCPENDKEGNTQGVEICFKVSIV